MATSQITSGSGIWTVESPDWITVTETTVGSTNRVNINIDLTPQNLLSAAPHAPLIYFKEPTGDADNFGFREEVVFTVVNHLGVPMDGVKLTLFNLFDFPNDDINAGHPIQYAHYHGVNADSFTGLTTSTKTPAGAPAGLGPATPIASIIEADGTIADNGSTTTPSFVVVHEWEVKGRNDDFFLSISPDLSPANLDKVVNATKPPSPDHIPQNLDPIPLLPANLKEVVFKYTGNEFLPLSNSVLLGTEPADKIFGTVNNDTVIAKNNADFIQTGENILGVPGTAKASTNFSPTGNDFVFAGEGDDIVIAKPSAAGVRGDYVEGWKGKDTIYGGQAILSGNDDDIVHAYDGVGATKGPLIIPGQGNDEVFFHEAVTGVGAVVPNTLLYEHVQASASSSGHDTLHNFQHGDIIAFRNQPGAAIDSLAELETVVTVTGNNEHFKIAFDDGSGSLDVFTPYANTPSFSSLQDVVNAGFKIDFFHDFV